MWVSFERLWAMFYLFSGIPFCSWKLAGVWWWSVYMCTKFSSVAQSCPTLCSPMNHSTPDLPVHHQLPESTQTHVHRVSDDIQPSHPLSSPSSLALSLSQHQRLFKWDRMPWSQFSECWALSQLFHSAHSLSSRGSLGSSSLSAIMVVSSAFLRLLIFLPAMLIPA